MRVLSKINRGLILTIAVVAAVVIYLVVVFFMHQSEEPQIKELCSKYLQTSVSYSMLPQQYRSDKPDMSSSELDNYLSKMKDDISSYYPSNVSYKDAVVGQFKSDLENQSKGVNVVYKYTKNIVKYKSIDFDGDSVTVNILTNATYDGPAISNMEKTGVSGRTAISGQTTDTISLAKFNGKWKITYANIQPPNQGGNEQNGVTVTMG